MELYQELFEKYWKVRLYKKLIRQSNLPTSYKMKRLLLCSRTLRRLRERIEKEIFLFPNQCLYVPGE